MKSGKLVSFLIKLSYYPNIVYIPVFLSFSVCVSGGIQSHSEHNRGDCYLKEAVMILCEANRPL